MTVSRNRTSALVTFSASSLKGIWLAAGVMSFIFGTSVSVAQEPFQGGAHVLPSETFEDALPPAVSESAEVAVNGPLSDIPDAEEHTVSTSELAAIDTAAVGVLDPVEGGLSPLMWKGSSRALVEKLLPGMPVATPSLVMNSLVRRLLLSRAEVPEGPPSVPSLLALRVERLMAAGWPNDVVTLLGRAVTVSDHPAVARTRSDALFLSGDLPAACVAAETMVQESDDPYWLKAVTLCRAKAGDIAGAALAVELFLEQGDVDPDFIYLSAALLSGGNEEPPKILVLDILRFEMLRALEIELSPEMEVLAPPAILRALANDQKLDLDDRLALADRAASIGAVTGDELGRIYGGIAFAPDDIPLAIDRAKTEPGPRSSALLYQLAVSGQDEGKGFSALQTLWRVADKQGAHRIISAATSGLIESVEPQEQLSWFAADAVRALLASGKLSRALNWYSFLSDEAQIRMWPLLTVADANGVVPPPAKAADLWLRTLADHTDNQKRRHAVRVFTLVEALGQPVSDNLWREALSDQADSVELPSPAVLQLLDRAQEGGRIGEATIFALKALTPNGPANSHSLVLAHVIRALTNIGLSNDARWVAVEALLGAGL